MKKTFLLSVLICAVMLIGLPSKAMATHGWVTIEGFMEEFSFHVPEGYFAYRNKDSGYFQLSSYKENVSINISVGTYLQPREHLKGLEDRYDPVDCKYEYYTEGPLTGKVFTCDGTKTYSKFLYVVSESRFYKIAIGAGSADDPNISIFLMSLKFRRFPMFPKYREPVDKNEKVVSEKGLKNDPLVEVYEKKPDNENIKVTTPKNAKLSVFDADSPVFSRELAIVRKKSKAFINVIKNRKPLSGTATLRVYFLAGGQIGKVEVLASSNWEYTQSLIDSLKEWRFVPAQIDGKDVDCARTFEYSTFTI